MWFDQQDLFQIPLSVPGLGVGGGIVGVSIDQCLVETYWEYSFGLLRSAKRKNCVAKLGEFVHYKSKITFVWANGWSGYGLPPWPPNGERLHVPPRRETHTRWLDASFVQKIHWWYSCKNAKYWYCHYVSYYPQWLTSQSIVYDGASALTKS